MTRKLVRDLPLSPTMVAALDEIKMKGGVIVRKPGGYWTEPDAVWNGNAYPWALATTTIEALQKRRRLAYTQWQQGRNGRFPVRAEMMNEDKQLLLKAYSIIEAAIGLLGGGEPGQLPASKRWFADAGEVLNDIGKALGET